MNKPKRIGRDAENAVAASKSDAEQMGLPPSSERPCLVCGFPRPMDRRSYCGEECAVLARKARERSRGGKRRTVCRRCNGPKEYGTRGGKYCNACREDLAPTWRQLEKERSRQRYMKELEARQGKRISRRTVDAPDGQKWCARCQEFQPVTRFSTSNGRWQAYCKPCQKSYNHELMLKRRFGVTAEQYMAMFDAQGGTCAICHRKPRKYKLAVDHDHDTGAIRGLLCSRCNHRLLGSANDSVDVLQRAIDYLTNPPASALLLRAAGYGDPLPELEVS